MATCELCGSNVNSLTPIKIAGSYMKVCPKCKGMGNQVEKMPEKAHTFKRKAKKNVTEEVVSDFVKKLNEGMKKKNINFHQLAKTLNIKESSITKYLSGKIKPDVETARMFERYFEIKFLEEVEDSSKDYEDVNNLMEAEELSEVTLGDLLKKQMEKK